MSVSEKARGNEILSTGGGVMSEVKLLFHCNKRKGGKNGWGHKESSTSGFCFLWKVNGQRRMMGEVNVCVRGIRSFEESENIWNSLCGDWKERELTTETLTTELVNNCGSQCECSDHVSSLYCYVIFSSSFQYPGDREGTKLSVEINQN